MANKHISYRQFKNIFGDLGVTYWTKYNWLSNGLPDGEYNGITKLTLAEDRNWQFYTADVVYDATQIPPRSNIIAPSDSTAFAYGFSNWKIVSRNDLDNVTEPSIAISFNGVFNFKVPGADTLEKALAYLKEHPIILYYYDRNVWGGVIVPNNNIGKSNGVFYREYTLPESVILHPTDGRDVLGEYEFNNLEGSTIQWKNLPGERLFGFGTTTPDLLRRVNFKNLDEDDASKVFPRAIVYKLVPEGWARVDLGTLDYDKDEYPGYNIFYTRIYASDTGYRDVHLEGYNRHDVSGSAMVDKDIKLFNGIFYIRDDTCSTVEKIKSKLSGKYLYYEEKKPL